MKARVVQAKGLRSHGIMEDGSATTLHVPGEGERKRGPTPMEHVVLGLAGCTAVDVVGILGKMRVPLRGLEVAVDYDRAKTHPRVLTRAHLTYRALGAVPEAKLLRAIRLSQERYCSVSTMLRAAGVALTWDRRIEPRSRRDRKTQSLK